MALDSELAVSSRSIHQPHCSAQITKCCINNLQSLVTEPDTVGFSLVLETTMSLHPSSRTLPSLGTSLKELLLPAHPAMQHGAES